MILAPAALWAMALWTAAPAWASDQAGAMQVAGAPLHSVATVLRCEPTVPVVLEGRLFYCAGYNSPHYRGAVFILYRTSGADPRQMEPYLCLEGSRHCLRGRFAAGAD